MGYNNYEGLYTGDLSKIAEQFTIGTWANAATASKERPKGIPGQVSAVSTIAGGTPFKVKGTGFLAIHEDSITERRRLLAKRGSPLAVENMPPTGQAYFWYRDVIQYVPLSAMLAAKQIARLCGDDSQVTIPWRSLADAVGRKNRAGNLVSYTERGVKALIDSGWLSKKTIGSKRGAKTTFYLQIGDFTDRGRLYEDEFLEDDGLV
ncbi:hypothetical protein ACFWVU_10660 [Streptomyces sp. NPDC058686]|uniref:hypothetical protein n=1 Tax=Streptomyces sp. NPDC058686 TaxID=3346599 RepID=UPI0036638823